MPNKLFIVSEYFLFDLYNLSISDRLDGDESLTRLSNSRPVSFDHDVRIEKNDRIFYWLLSKMKLGCYQRLAICFYTAMVSTTKISYFLIDVSD